MGGQKVKKGLGSGLEALFGAESVSDEQLDCSFLPISKVESAEKQPRTRFDGESLAALSESIAEHGVIQPITVRRLSTGYYQIIAGERRWRAAKMAGLKEIPARIVDADDRDAAVLALVENLQREDLNPIEEAKGIRSLIDEFGFTQEAAASQINRSRSAVTNSLRLLSLPEDVCAMLEDGRLSAGHARALLPLEKKELITAVAEAVLRQGLSVRQTELLVKQQLSSGKRRQKKPDPAGVYAAELEERLLARLGRRVKIKSGTKKGKIEIEYYGNEDLDRVITALDALAVDNGGEPK
ncbi:MAG: ParB/RepB/Spo0J family partition protein [Oscillospiraceae bacterium]|jgi:ParB family chromosome partitioning protein|nr:ParB/RepB/Spo0J family partition protein [Oscillospiraceae bacterium]